MTSNNKNQKQSQNQSAPQAPEAPVAYEQPVLEFWKGKSNAGNDILRATDSDGTLHCISFPKEGTELMNANVLEVYSYEGNLAITEARLARRLDRNGKPYFHGEYAGQPVNLFGNNVTIKAETSKRVGEETVVMKMLAAIKPAPAATAQQ